MEWPTLKQGELFGCNYILQTSQKDTPFHNILDTQFELHVYFLLFMEQLHSQQVILSSRCFQY